MSNNKLLEKYKISFIGSGNMAEALIKGLINLILPNQIIASDINEIRLKYIEKETGIRITSNNQEAVKFGDIIILAIKPQILNLVLPPLKKDFNNSKILISILAGTKIKKLQKSVGNLPIIRVMPNIAVLVKEGASGICFNKYCNEKDEKIAFSIFNAVGKSVKVKESLMDVITGLSGSGPAYIFTIIEALAKAGEKMGLSYETAITLAAQTVLGAAWMILETKENPQILKNKVTSKGGTTFAGLKVLEEKNIQSTIIDAVFAATNRAKELSQE